MIVPIITEQPNTQRNKATHVIPEGKIRKTISLDNLTKDLITAMKLAGSVNDDTIIETATDVFITDALEASNRKTNELASYIARSNEQVGRLESTFQEIRSLLPTEKRYAKNKVKIDFIIDEELLQVREKLILVLPNTGRTAFTILPIKMLAYTLYRTAIDGTKPEDGLEIPECRQEIASKIIGGLIEMTSKNTTLHNPKDSNTEVAE